MFKFLPVVVLLLFLIPKGFSAENSKGYVEDTAKVTIRFDFTFRKIEGPRNPLAHFLGTATLGDTRVFRDGTVCNTQGSIMNLTETPAGDFVGAIVLTQEGHCRLASQSSAEFHDQLAERYLKHLSEIPGLTATRLP